MTLAFHPLADLFPLIEGAEFDELVADVKVNGLHEKIAVLDGTILDGRNRYRAALAAGLLDADDGPDRSRYFTRFVPAVDGAPLAYVISRNLKRRHLNDDQRRMVAARIANMGRGRPAENPAECGIKVAEAARMVNVDQAGAERARTVLTKAAPEIRAAVDRGKLTVAAATQATKLDPDKQRAIAEEALAGRANVVRTVLKQETRTIRERELADKQLGMPDGKFGVILVDWPRRHQVWSRDSGLDRSPDNHYPTQDFDWACGLPVADWAATDCLLVMCTTAASLVEDIEIAAEWGFCALRPRDGLGKLSRPNGVALPPVGDGTYRSHQVWDKVRRGTGRWFIDRHELWLILVKGSIPCPAPGTQEESLFSEERTEHSAKPVRLLAWIERHWPNLRKLEVFRRGAPRPGWDAWGNEAVIVPEAAAPAAETAAQAVSAEAETGPGAVASDLDPDLPPGLRIGDPQCWRGAPGNGATS